MQTCLPPGRTSRRPSLATALAAALGWAVAAGAQQAAPPAPSPAPSAKPSPKPPTLPPALATGKVAYEDNGVIKVLDLATFKTESFDLPERMEHPAWNPDGKRFAYSSSFGVSLLDIQGQSFTSLTPPGQEAVEASWSPEGQRLAYEVRGNEAGLHVYDLRDKGRKRLTSTLKASQVAWHPKDERLAFVAQVDGREQLFVLELACAADASCDRAARALLKDGQNRAPAWSPDGKQLAVERDAGDGAGSGIFVLQADGSGLRRVSPKGSDDHAPAWGGPEALAYQCGAESPGICVMKTDGSARTTVVPAGRNPTWWQARP